MTYDEAVRIAKDPAKGGDYVRWTTALALIYDTHQRRQGRQLNCDSMTWRDAPPPRKKKTVASFLRAVDEMRAEMRMEKASLGTSMPMPSGILPTPPPIDPKTGIPMPRMSTAALAAQWRIEDTARSQRLLREMNAANRRHWEQRK